MCIPENRIYGEYPNLIDAQNACSQQDDCIGVYDWECNNKEFSLCTKGWQERSSNHGSCAYMKGRGNLFIIFCLITFNSFI